MPDTIELTTAISGSPIVWTLSGVSGGTTISMSPASPPYNVTSAAELALASNGQSFTITVDGGSPNTSQDAYDDITTISLTVSNNTGADQVLSVSGSRDSALSVALPNGEVLTFACAVDLSLWGSSVGQGSCAMAILGDPGFSVRPVKPPKTNLQAQSPAPLFEYPTASSGTDVVGNSGGWVTFVNSSTASIELKLSGAPSGETASSLSIEMAPSTSQTLLFDFGYTLDGWYEIGSSSGSLQVTPPLDKSVVRLDGVANWNDATQWAICVDAVSVADTLYAVVGASKNAQDFDRGQVYEVSGTSFNATPIWTFGSDWDAEVYCSSVAFDKTGSSSVVVAVGAASSSSALPSSDWVTVYTQESSTWTPTSLPSGSDWANGQSCTSLAIGASNDTRWLVAGRTATGGSSLAFLVYQLNDLSNVIAGPTWATDCTAVAFIELGGIGYIAAGAAAGGSSGFCIYALTDTGTSISVSAVLGQGGSAWSQVHTCTALEFATFGTRTYLAVGLDRGSGARFEIWSFDPTQGLTFVASGGQNWNDDDRCDGLSWSSTSGACLLVARRHIGSPTSSDNSIEGYMFEGTSSLLPIQAPWQPANQSEVRGVASVYANERINVVTGLFWYEQSNYGRLELLELEDVSS